MSRRISQETFDAVVRECEDDFALTREQALRDAIAQFASQGVDLSNVDVTGGEGVGELEGLWEEAQDSESRASRVEALQQLQTLCSEASPLSSRNHHIFLGRGWMTALLGLLADEMDNSVLTEVLLLLQTIMRLNTEARDAFEPQGSHRLVNLIQRLLLSDPEAPKDALVACYKLASTAAKSERNKNALFKQGIASSIVEILRSDSVASESGSELTRAACLCMKALCNHDDTRSEISCAGDNGKFFLSAGAVPLLLQTVGHFKRIPAAASAALSACKQLVLTEEAVQIVALHGGMDLPRLILSDPSTDVNMVRAVLGLARNICADDNRKNQLANDGTLELIVNAIGSDRYCDDPNLVEHGIACLAAMALRFPANSLRIVRSGAISLVVRNMERHATRSALCRQACNYHKMAELLFIWMH